GRTRKEAARQLGVPEGTVAGRLARARKLLAKRLTARGVTLSGGALAAVLAHNAALAGVPDAVVSSTISAANLFAAESAAAAGVISPKVAALTDGVLKTMLQAKLKNAVLLLFVIVVLGWGGGAVWQTQANDGQATPSGELTEVRTDLSGTWQGSDWGTVVLR